MAIDKADLYRSVTIFRGTDSTAKPLFSISRERR